MLCIEHTWALLNLAAWHSFVFASPDFYSEAGEQNICVFAVVARLGKGNCYMSCLVFAVECSLVIVSECLAS